MTVTPVVLNFFAMVVSCDACQSRLKTGDGAHDVASLMTGQLERKYMSIHSLCFIVMQADLHAFHT